MRGKIVKRVIALALGVVMTTSLITACGEKEKVSDSTAALQSEAAAESTETALEPYEFDMYYNYDWYDVSSTWGKDEISAELQEKFKITMNQAKPEGDPIQKLNIMMASDDLPDAMMMDRDANYLKLIELGKLVELDSYIEKYPGYKSIVDPATINLAKVNGKAYGLLNWATTKEHPTGNAGWIVNKKIYEQLGSPSLATMEDVYNYTKLVKENNITVNGKAVVPIQFESYTNMVEMVANSYGMGVMPGIMGGVVPINGELKNYMNHPKYIDAMMYMNKLWNDNLLNKDCFVEKADQIQEKLSTGRVAIYSGSDVASNVKTYRMRMKEVDPDNDYIVIPSPAAEGVNPSDVKNGSYMTLGWNVIVITDKCKQPERVFQLMDYIVSTEGSRLTSYGPKGTLYDEVDENGYPILKKTISELSDAENKAIGISLWQLVGNTLFADMSKVADDNRKPVEQRDWVIQAQSNIIWKHSMNVDAFINTIPDPQSDEGIAAATFADLDKQAIPKIIMSKNETELKQEIQKTLDNAYKQGYDKVEKFKNDVYQKNLEQMGN